LSRAQRYNNTPTCCKHAEKRKNNRGNYQTKNKSIKYRELFYLKQEKKRKINKDMYKNHTGNNTKKESIDSQKHTRIK
jgi:hypothetical protein